MADWTEKDIIDSVNDSKIGLSSPWVEYARKVNALFGQDPQIKCKYDNENISLILYVDDDDKAAAIQDLLAPEAIFGRVVLKIRVIPSNNKMTQPDSLFERAFKGNPAFSYAKVISGVFANPLSYVVFKKKVVQFFNDDLSDIHGCYSGLYEDIARDLFEIPGVCYCTDTDSENSPLGEWP